MAEETKSAADAFVDKIAKRIAVGNNGGDWANHYTEDQKVLWRLRAAEIIAEIEWRLKRPKAT
jgi:hypothetical protein